jgi:RND superfamily putative drug exporter
MNIDLRNTQEIDTTVRDTPRRDVAARDTSLDTSRDSSGLPRPRRRSALTSLGWFAVRRRRLVLSLTVLFVVVAAVLGVGAFGVLQGGGFDDPNSESVRAADVLESEFGGGDPNIVLVLRSDGSVDDAERAAAGRALTEQLAAVEGMESVESYWTLGSPPPLRSTDESSALVLGIAVGEEADIEATVERVREAFAEEASTGPFEVLVGGREAVFTDVGTTIEGDLGRAELIAIPLTLILLLFVFRGVVAASLPLMVGVISVFGTFLSLYILGSVTDVSVYAINLTTALGLGLSIDYSLFIVSRFREELRAGRPVEHAVVRTVETAGKTVRISGLTVAASLSALLVFPQFFLRSFAYAGIAVVLIAMTVSLLSLSSLLAVVGHRINSLQIGGKRNKVVNSEEDGRWYRIAMAVMKRPVPIALGVVAVLLLLGSPFLRVVFGTTDDRVLPENASSRITSEVLRTEFTGNASESFGVVATGVDTSTGEAGTAIEITASTISELEGVARVESANGTFVDGVVVNQSDADARFSSPSATWMSVVPAFAVASAQGEELVQDIRSLEVPLDVQVEGQAASLVDTKESIGSRLPLAISIIVLATFVLLFMLSGSLLVPVKALLLNFLSLTATFGAMVWIFQDGNFSDLLGFTATGSIDTSMPILMFCIAFGLSMDYEVFLLSRIKEEHDRTGDNTAAVALGIERTGRIVTAAAALLAITFFAFGTSGVSFIKMFGIGLGIAVLMDATVVRGLLVPAFMRLAGEANWWAPGPLRRFHDRFGISEQDSESPLDTSEEDRELVGATT